MTLAEACAAAMFVGITLYALLAGADFGAGFWDLVAGGEAKGREQRALIEESIAPVWEANHVWLIFVLVTLWTAFPSAFASIMSTLYVPLTLAAVGIILRGAAFAFRKASETLPLRRLFGATFASSSVLTPFMFGAVVGDPLVDAPRRERADTLNAAARTLRPLAIGGIAALRPADRHRERP